MSVDMEVSVMMEKVSRRGVSSDERRLVEGVRRPPDYVHRRFYAMI